MHTTSVQTHIMQSFSHRCQAKGQTHSPRGEDNQVVIKTPNKCNHGKHLRAGGKDNALEMA